MSKLTTGTKGLDIIKTFEGFKSFPYLCPANIPTIGYGSTFYTNGSKVTMKDASITEPQALELLKGMLSSFESSVLSLCTKALNQNQFDALVSFTYNVGAGNLKSSTLLKKVNSDPSDPSIKDEFLKWNKGGGKVLSGLTKRREAESSLYFQQI